MQEEGFQVTAEFEETHWWYLSRQELIREQLEIALADINSNDISLLDFGCGTGFLLNFFSRYATTVVGADVSLHRLSDKEKNPEFKRLDLNQDCSNYYGKFDILTSLDVLEHIEDDLAGLQHMSGFLKTGGQMLLTVPAYQWLWGGEDIISEHKRRYTKTSLSAVCHKAGAEILNISYFNTIFLPAIAAVIWGRKILTRGHDPKSNLSHLPKLLNKILLNISSTEAIAIGKEKVSPWIGASLICRIRF